MIKRVLIVLLLTLLLLPVVARGQLLGGLGGGPRASGESVTARAVAVPDELPPGGQGQVVIELSIGSRYHVQSAFAGDGFIASVVTVTQAPTSLKVGVIEAQEGTQIPTPPALGQGTMSVYEGKAYFLVPVTIATVSFQPLRSNVPPLIAKGWPSLIKLALG